MMKITCRRELKAPGKVADIDFSNPKLAPMVRVLENELRQAVREFVPSQGVKAGRFFVDGWDGAQIECFLVEPEDSPERLPAMLYCHGGGFFLPIQPMMMELAARYVKSLRIRVVLPEYRILPDHPNPYPFRDCLAVWNWMCKQESMDPENLLLYGESAGATLAAGIGLWNRDRSEHPVKGQMLIYPVLDNRCSRYPSMRLYSEGIWPLRSNIAMWQAYLKNGDAGLGDYLIPMRTEDLSGLPQTYLEPQELDILRDEAIAFADRLKNAGVPVQVNLIEGSYHGFDADVENPFVQSIVKQRIQVMEQMLQDQ